MSSQLRHSLEELLGPIRVAQYMRSDEVPEIPREPTPTRYVVYAPLSKAACMPDVLLLHGTPQQVMLLVEAANARQVARRVPDHGKAGLCRHRGRDGER